MSGAKRVGKYPDEMRERGVRMLFEHQHEYPSQWAVHLSAEGGSAVVPVGACWCLVVPCGAW